MSPVHSKDKFAHQRSRYLRLSVKKNLSSPENKKNRSAVSPQSPSEVIIDYSYINKDIAFSLGLAAFMIALLFVFSFYKDQIPYFHQIISFIFPS